MDDRVRIRTTFGWLAALLLLAGTISALYISKERFFYFWDFGGFQGVAIELANKLDISVREVLTSVKDSLQLEYNLIFALPLIPFIQILGDTRMAYVMGVTLVYQVGYALALGAVATKLVPEAASQRARHWVFWGTAFLALLTPIAWAPTLRAYPDIGAALLIALAIYVYLIDPKLSRFWQILLISLLIAGAALFRRHFIYDGLALILAIGFQTAFRIIKDARQNSRQAARELLQLSVRVILAGITVALAMAVFDRPFLARLVSTNYLTLYQSYLLPPGEVLQFFFRSYGWLTWLGVLAGYGIGIWKKTLDRSAAIFMLLFGSMAITLWVFLAGQRSIQYALHASTFVILGLSALIWTIIHRSSGYLRVAALVLAACLILSNFVYGLTTWSIPGKLARPLSEKYAPLVRPDYDEVVRLVAYLREISQPDDPIYIADSSGLMNYDLIVKAEEAIYGRKDRKLNIFVTPQIDSRDYYPLEQLLRSKYLIYTIPFQHHLPTDGQRVVKVILEMFAQRWSIAADFKLLPGKFQLADGGILSVFQRVNQTSPETAIQTFNRMVAFIDQIPGTQPEWIEIQGPVLPPLDRGSDGSYHTALTLSSNTPVASFLYAYPLPDHSSLEGTIMLRGESCKQVGLETHLTDKDGKLLHRKSQVIDYELNGSGPFAFQTDSLAATNLVFSVVMSSVGNSSGECEIELNWQLKPISP